MGIETNMQRRQLLISLPVVLSAGPITALAQTSELHESDPAAVAVQYKADATKVDRAKTPDFQPGRTCANCSVFFPQAGSPLGGCQLFVGKEVAAIGWCNAWEAKAQ